MSLLSFQYFDFLGIARNRLITGPIQVMKYALLPREGGCQDAAYSAWELHTMREKLLTISRNQQSSHSLYLRWQSSSSESGQAFPLKSSSNHSSCNVLLLYRTMTKFSQNLFDKKRRFPAHILHKIVSLLQDTTTTTQAICSVFHPQKISRKLNIRIFSDDDELLMKCIPCQIELFAQSNLVIGVSVLGLILSRFRHSP
jgi:hypothetical protein